MKRRRRVIQVDYYAARRIGRLSEWEIDGVDYAFDRRVKHKLQVSYGIADSAGHREVALKIDNRVVVLDSTSQAMLLILLADARPNKEAKEKSR